MPISMQELNRIVKLHGIIEDHKEHSHAAPTYKDSPYLAEMAQIALAPRDRDIETLEEIIPTLWYLTECYDKNVPCGNVREILHTAASSPYRAYEAQRI